MKKIIGKLLRYFITRYRLYLLVGRGKKIYLKIDDMNFLTLKEDEYKSVIVHYWIKTKKKKIYINGLLVNITSEKQPWITQK